MDIIREYFIDEYSVEIDRLKALIKTELGFTPKSELPEDIDDEVTAHGWGYPDLVPKWEAELAEPHPEMVENPFVLFSKDDSGLVPNDYWFKERKPYLENLVKSNKGKKQIPEKVEKALHRMIQEQYDYWENFELSEEDRIYLQIGYPDSPTVSDEAYAASLEY